MKDGVTKLKDIDSKRNFRSEQKLATQIITNTTCDDGKSVFQTTIDTIKFQEAKGRKDDFKCDQEDECFACLSALVSDKELRIDTAALEPFGASEDDLIRVFVKWSYKDESGQYNVSKAYRRLQEYVEWMERNCKDFDFNPETMVDAHNAWAFFVNHDKHGRLVWWGDCDLNNFEKIKHEIPYDDTLRYFTYLSHLFMFDAGAQEHGMICVDQMGNKSVVDYFSMVPIELGTKLDRISVGILPVKVKKLYMYNCARWMWVIAGIMAPFASAKMRKRICFIKGNPQERLESDLGCCIPTQMGGMNGTIETDMLAQLFSKNISGASTPLKSTPLKNNDECHSWCSENGRTKSISSNSSEDTF